MRQLPPCKHIPFHIIKQQKNRQYWGDWPHYNLEVQVAPQFSQFISLGNSTCMSLACTNSRPLNLYTRQIVSVPENKNSPWNFRSSNGSEMSTGKLQMDSSWMPFSSSKKTSFDFVTRTANTDFLWSSVYILVTRCRTPNTNVIPNSTVDAKDIESSFSVLSHVLPAFLQSVLRVQWIKMNRSRNTICVPCLSWLENTTSCSERSCTSYYCQIRMLAADNLGSGCVEVPPKYVDQNGTSSEAPRSHNATQTFQRYAISPEFIFQLCHNLSNRFLEEIHHEAEWQCQTRLATNRNLLVTVSRVPLSHHVWPLRPRDFQFHQTSPTLMREQESSSFSVFFPVKITFMSSQFRTRERKVYALRNFWNLWQPNSCWKKSQNLSSTFVAPKSWQSGTMSSFSWSGFAATISWAVMSIVPAPQSNINIFWWTSQITPKASSVWADMHTHSGSRANTRFSDCLSLINLTSWAALLIIAFAHSFQIAGTVSSQVMSVEETHKFSPRFSFMSTSFFYVFQILGQEDRNPQPFAVCSLNKRIVAGRSVQRHFRLLKK